MDVTLMVSAVMSLVEEAVSAAAPHEFRGTQSVPYTIRGTVACPETYTKQYCQQCITHLTTSNNTLLLLVLAFVI